MMEESESGCQKEKISLILTLELLNSFFLCLAFHATDADGELM